MTIDNSTITALTGLAVVITAPIMLYLQIQAKKQSAANGQKIDEQAVKVEEVKKLGITTHELVNSKFGKSLLDTANLAQRVFEISKSPVDEQKAISSRRESDEHIANQATVDNAASESQGKPT